MAIKLIVEITTQDDKMQKYECYECVDFPSTGGDFITLYQSGSVRRLIRTETVLHIRQYLK